MRYNILVAREAIEGLNKLKPNIRAEVKDAIERHLRFEPQKLSKSRIKRLRGLTRPQFRLRVNDVRVFYDVGQATVEVLAIVHKSTADKWLESFGEQ